LHLLLLPLLMLLLLLFPLWWVPLAVTYIADDFLCCHFSAAVPVIQWLTSAMLCCSVTLFFAALLGPLIHHTQLLRCSVAPSFCCFIAWPLHCPLALAPHSFNSAAIHVVW
jgi:hypothetical protein